MIDHLDAIELDLHQIYGIDLGDRDLLRTRTWDWLRRRIIGLLEVRSRTLWAYQGEEWQEKMAEAVGRGVHPLPWL